MKRYGLALLAALALGGLTESAQAQAFNMARSGKEPIDISADEGIEWMSDATRVVARGHAKAVRGTMTVTADSLTAYYRDGKQGGGSEIWRLDADGNVTITTPTDTATGRKATYDLDQAIFVLRGDPAKIVTPTDVITATDMIEYWENQQMAVARGNAVATRADRRITADVLTAHFKENQKNPSQPTAKKGKSDPAQGSSGGQELQRADAYGNVVITTPDQRASGEKGEYNAETSIATLTGSVKLNRGGNELNGGYGWINMNTGISKLFAAAPGGKGMDRVSGSFLPDKSDDETAAPKSKSSKRQ